MSNNAVVCDRCGHASADGFHGTAKGLDFEYLCNPCHDVWLSKQAPRDSLELLARKLGMVVADKQRQYGDSVTRTSALLDIFYPDGVKPHHYPDLLFTVRVLDKLCRISQREAANQDLGGESPWLDVAGYALLAWRKEQ